MKKVLSILMCGMLLCAASAMAEGAEPKVGKADGFGGVLTVAVTMDGETITAVEVTENSETEAIAGEALTAIPAAIVEKNATEVDAFTGATVTSNAIMAAVNNAIDPEANPYAEAAEETAAPIEGESVGMGASFMGRIGPGKDDTETQVYSFNGVFATARFDAEGRIMSLLVDQLEVATPNYDGDGMPHLSGFPGQGGYNNDENHDGTVDGKTEDSDDAFMAEVSAWQTKRQRGDSYKMTSGTWAGQMDKFQQLFVGMTVDEVDEWFAAYCSDRNGRPLKAGSENEEDAAKYDALSDADKEMLADVTTTATISLNDGHGDILAAIRNAYDNRVAAE